MTPAGAFALGSVVLSALLVGCEPPAAPTPPQAAIEFDHGHPLLRDFLGRHVRKGLVDYPCFKDGDPDLDQYLALAGRVPRSQFDGWSAPQRLAFLLNTYNASMLRLVARHYPLDNVRAIGGVRSVWKMSVVELFGRWHSLDDLEHGMIRRQFKTPQIHFALVCGARSCPPLRDEPYTATNLEAQFAEQARAFLADPVKNRVDWDRKVVHLSPLFRWYAEDFGKSEEELLRFIASSYSAAEAEALRGGGFTIRYNEYDWSPNAVPPEK